MKPWEKDPAFVWPLLERPVYSVSDELPESIPGGPRIGELVKLARYWWDRIGRHMLKQRCPLAAETGGVASGILRAQAFEYLDRGEAVTVVKAYYRGVWVPTEQARREAFRLDPLKGPGMAVKA